MVRDLKKTISLKKAFDFKKTLNYGRFAGGEYIAVYVLKRKSHEKQDQNLFGICVSKKHGNSVVRNKLKRWAREAYKEIEENIVLGNIVVILYKKDIKDKIDKGELNFFKVKQDMEKALKKLELLIEDKQC